MDFLKSQLGKATTGIGSGGEEKPAAEKHTQGVHQPASTGSGGEEKPAADKHTQGVHQPDSPGELFSDAKLLAGAAKSTLNNESDKVDRGKVAESSEDLLDAASHYGKLEEKGYGKYVDKAEDYIHQYSTTTTTKTTTTVGSGGHSDAPPPTKTHDSTTTTAPPQEGGGESGDAGSENKYGEYFKKAEGFFK